MMVTHLGGQAYLSMVDSASRSAIWQSKRNETSREVQQLLWETFTLFGPPEETSIDTACASTGESYVHFW